MPKIIFQPLMIANPQIPNRLGHFLKADCKSAWTPGGFAPMSTHRQPPVSEMTE